MKKWKVDETTKCFINLKLEKGKQDIIEFRRRWKLGDKGLKDGRYFSSWKKRIEKECQNLRRPIRISELEAYFDMPDIPLARPVLSSTLENGLREENLGDSLPVVYKIELRALGKKIGIPAEFDLFLDHFVTYNVANFDLIFNHGVKTSIRYRINEEFGLISENVCIILGQNTGSEDLDNLWKKRIKPLLENLFERIKDKNRKSKDYKILEELSKRDGKSGTSQKTKIDIATDKKMGVYDVEIAMSSMSEKERDELYEGVPIEEQIKTEKKLSRKVQNIRYYRTKRRPL